MKERPILFNGAMVRALLAGTKTQTRRVFKQATGPSLSVGIEDKPGIAELSWLSGDGPGHDVHETVREVPCPYGLPGDRLWVRETWMVDPPRDGTWPSSAFDGCKPRDHSLIPEQYRTSTHCRYRADGHDFHGWTPAIHMFRWASRLTLEITDVRVERLQDISEADAAAEGVTAGKYAGLERPHARTYSELWETINGAGSWDANPWVWAVSFKVVKP